jgi:predicted nucleotidyltransferase
MTEVEKLPDLEYLFTGITGSTAYGLAHADSDIDRKGVFIHHLDERFQLDPWVETYTQHEPDFEVHEIGKYLRLTLGCNPNLLELLFLPQDCVEHFDFDWFELVNNRDRFLSERAVRASYGGYAKQQVERLKQRNAEGKDGFSSDVQKRTAKHARHCFRLFWQGAELLRTGEMNVRLTGEQRELLFTIGDLPVEKLVKLFEAEDQRFQQIESGLPEEPDRQWVKDWLIDLRRSRVSPWMIGRSLAGS